MGCKWDLVLTVCRGDLGLNLGLVPNVIHTMNTFVVYNMGHGIGETFINELKAVRALDIRMQ